MNTEEAAQQEITSAFLTSLKDDQGYLVKFASTIYRVIYLMITL